MTRKEMKKRLKKLAKELDTLLHEEAWETIFHDKVDEVDEYIIREKVELLDEVFFDDTYDIKECVRIVYG